MKKKLLLNKRTISKLDINQVNILENDEQKNVNGGSQGAGVTNHPIYCVP